MRPISNDPAGISPAGLTQKDSPFFEDSTL